MDIIQKLTITTLAGYALYGIYKLAMWWRNRNQTKDYIRYLEMEVHHIGQSLSDEKMKQKHPDFTPLPNPRSETHLELHERFKKRLYGITIQVINYENPDKP